MSWWSGEEYPEGFLLHMKLGKTADGENGISMVHSMSIWN